MTSLAAFTLVRDVLPSPSGEERLWSVCNVSYGERTNWNLLVGLSSRERFAKLRFGDVVSFRVQDEGEMLEYWAVRDHENVSVGPLYLIGDSDYKRDIEDGGLTGMTEKVPLFHYLLAGDAICVEVITTAPPVFSEGG